VVLIAAAVIVALTRRWRRPPPTPPTPPAPTLDPAWRARLDADLERYDA